MKNKKHKIDPRNHFNNYEEFNNFMKKIDNKLKEKGIPIVARQIKGAGEVAKALDTNIYIAPLPPAKPNDFSNYSLSAHVADWFDKRYGDRLKMNITFGNTIVLINNDFYKVHLPCIYGKPQYIFDPTLKIYDKFKDPRFNVANLIEGITSDLAKEVNNLQRAIILNKISKGIFLGQLMEHYIEVSFIEEARADLIQSVELLFQHKPYCGMSKWSSLQFSEKVLKAFLSHKNESFPRTHKLDKLIKHIRKYELKCINEIELDKIQCTPDVRYDSNTVKMSEAVQAHCESIDLGLVILQQF